MEPAVDFVLPCPDAPPRPRSAGKAPRPEAPFRATRRGPLTTPAHPLPLFSERSSPAREELLRCVKHANGALRRRRDRRAPFTRAHRNVTSEARRGRTYTFEGRAPVVNPPVTRADDAAPSRFEQAGVGDGVIHEAVEDGLPYCAADWTSMYRGFTPKEWREGARRLGPGGVTCGHCARKRKA